MAENKMALLDALRKGDEPDGDVLAQGVRWLLHELMEAEVGAHIGAERYEQTDRAGAAAQLRRVCETLASRSPAVVQRLEEAEGEILTFYDFPAEHRRQIYSTNPLERLTKELKRRSAGVGIFLNRLAVLRLFCALLAEQNDEWLVGRHYFSETSMRNVLHPLEEEVTEVTAA